MSLLSSKMQCDICDVWLSFTAPWGAAAAAETAGGPEWEPAEVFISMAAEQRAYMRVHRCNNSPQLCVPAEGVLAVHDRSRDAGWVGGCCETSNQSENSSVFSGL